MFRKIISAVLITAFVSYSLYIPQAHAGEMVTMQLSAPGVMVHLSPEFTPAHLQGLTIHPDNALQFDFLIRRGDGPLESNQKKEEYTKLVKYFLASLTVPDEDQWVNLSPYEHNRIIKDDFGKTEMGRDLLSQDYLLKQITSSLMYPETGLGKDFWDKVYERAYKEYGTNNIPVNTFNKVWIIPDEAAVYESGNTVYILRNHLKVMLEEDYLSLEKHSAVVPPGSGIRTHSVTSKIVKEIILPELEKEVNEGKNFAMLRQIYSGMILATWYKHALKESLLGRVYVNKAKVSGVDQKDPRANEAIYQQYLKAFKKGVFNYIKEDTDQYSRQLIPRKYFAGGMVDFAQVVTGPAATRGFSTGAVEVFTEETNIPPSVAGKIDFAEIAKNDTDRATVELDAGDRAQASEEDSNKKRNETHLSELYKKLQENPDLFKDLLKFEKFEALGMKNVIKEEKIYARSQEAAEPQFHNQQDMQNKLAALYTADQDILDALQGHDSSPEDIQALVFARIDQMAAQGRLNDNQRRRLRAEISSEVSTDKYKQKYSLFALLTVWVKGLRSQNQGAHMVYLARDAGFLHLIEGVINPGHDSSVYHLSRARMSGEANNNVYAQMHKLIDIAVAESGGQNYEGFLEKLQALFEERAQGDASFRKAVVFAADEMRALGYGQGDRQNLVLVDTGFYGTIPLFLRAALLFDARTNGRPHPNVTIALIQPSSIKQFAQEMYGYNLSAFSPQERAVLDQLDVLSMGAARKDNVGSELEGVESHPIGFRETTYTIQESEAEEQVIFYYEQAVAVAAAVAFVKKLSEAGDDIDKMREYLGRYITENFETFIKHKAALNKIDINDLVFKGSLKPEGDLKSKDIVIHAAEKTTADFLGKMLDEKWHKMDIPTIDMTGMLNLMEKNLAVNLKVQDFNLEKIHFKDNIIFQQVKAAKTPRWPAWLLAAHLFFAQPDMSKKKESSEIPAIVGKQNPDQAMVTSPADRVEDITGKYLKGIVGTAEVKEAGNTGILRRGFLGFVGALGVAAAVSSPMQVLAQERLSGIDIDSLNEFRSFIDRIKTSSGFSLPMNGEKVREALGYKSKKFADLYNLLIERLSMESRARGGLEQSELKSLIIKIGEEIIAQHQGNVSDVNLETGRLDETIKKFKDKFKEANEAARIQEVLLEFELYLRQMLQKDQGASGQLFKALSDFNSVLLAKGFLIEQSPLGLRDEKAIVLYQIVQKENQRVSKGVIPVYHVRQVTKYADGLLRGNNGWSSYFTDYVVVFDEAIEQDAKNYLQALEQNKPTFRAVNNSSAQGRIIDQLSQLERDFLQKIFPPGQRNENYVGQVIKEIVSSHEVEHKLRALRAGTKEGSVVHTGDEERAAILASMFRPADPTFELARMMKLAAASFDPQQRGLIFSWQILIGLMKIDPKGKTNEAIMEETIKSLRSFLNQPNMKNELKERAKTHYEAVFGYKPETVTVDKAMLGGEKDSFGGIDLNAANLNLFIKRDGRGVPLPLLQQDWAKLNSIRGFMPTIIEIKPVTALPILTELQQKLRSS